MRLCGDGVSRNRQPFRVQEQEEREDKGALAKYTRVSVDRLVARSIGSTNLYQKALGSMLSREQARAREREREGENRNSQAFQANYK